MQKSSSYFDHNGKRQAKSARTTDKAAAVRIAQKLEADAALRRERVIDPAIDDASKQGLRSVDEHLTDHEAKLRADGLTDDYVTRTIKSITTTAEWAGFERAADISADGVNRKTARQYIQPDLANGRREHVGNEATKTRVFALPHPSNMARMLHDDLAEAKRLWMHDATDDPNEYACRSESDFLDYLNDDSERLDFHALRHTCGAWLALKGVHPNVIQAIMRHSTITLTMDTYGHLFPDQEAEAVARLADLIPRPAIEAKATGTDDSTPLERATSAAHMQRAQRQTQQLGRETMRGRAVRCRNESGERDKRQSPKPLAIADLGDDVRDDALSSKSRAGGTRTPDPAIMSRLL